MNCFVSMNLNACPSTWHLAGIKVYESNESQLFFELALRWAGNPNMILAAKLLSAKVTVQVYVMLLNFCFIRKEDSQRSCIFGFLLSIIFYCKKKASRSSTHEKKRQMNYMNKLKYIIFFVMLIAVD